MRICDLLGVARADNRLLHEIGRVFGDRQAGARRDQHRDAARLTELERRIRIFVDEGRFDRGLVRRMLLDDAHEPVMDADEARRHVLVALRIDRTAGDENQPVALAFDQAPAGAAKARIDAENANHPLAHVP